MPVAAFAVPGLSAIIAIGGFVAAVTVKCGSHEVPRGAASWITSEDPKALKEFIRFKSRHIAYDMEGNPVFFAESQWWLDQMKESNLGIQNRRKTLGVSL